jgi:transposase
LADDRRRPGAVALTPGNLADITMAVPLLGSVAAPKRLIADKAYDADTLRRWLKERRIEPVIPPHPAPFLIRSTAPLTGAATASSASSAV